VNLVSPAEFEEHVVAALDALPPEIDVFHVEPLQVPKLGAERCLVWMRRRHAAGA